MIVKTCYAVVVALPQDTWTYLEQRRISDHYVDRVYEASEDPTRLAQYIGEECDFSTIGFTDHADQTIYEVAVYSDPEAAQRAGERMEAIIAEYNQAAADAADMIPGVYDESDDEPF